MPSPVRRLMFRYRRWQYKREMALPTPNSPRPHSRTHEARRTVDKLTHPRRTLVHAYERRVSSRPAPPPRSEAELHGGRIHRRYVRTRIALSNFVHDFPERPIVFQLLTCAVVGVVVGGVGLTGYHALRSKPKPRGDVLAAFGDASTFYTAAREDTKKGAVRVLVAGDGSVYHAAEPVGNDITTGGIHAVGLTAGGCGIGSSDILIGTRHVTLDRPCSAGWQKAYATTVSQYKPAVSVLMTGYSRGIRPDRRRQDARAPLARVAHLHDPPARCGPCRAHGRRRPPRAREPSVRPPAGRQPAARLRQRALARVRAGPRPPGGARRPQRRDLPRRPDRAHKDRQAAPRQAERCSRPTASSCSGTGSRASRSRSPARRSRPAR